MNKRFNFLGVQISVINFQEALQQITDFNYSSPAYICFPDASVVAEASKVPLLRSILNNALLTMPDGKPAQLLAHLYGFKGVTTVSGFHLCSALLQTNKTHFFYGGNEELLAALQRNITQKYPGAKILGYKAPPFLNVDNIQNNVAIARDIEHINLLKPDLVWVGISSPKQDFLMHFFYRQLNRSLMLGVGGVFLYFADESLKSPEWVKKAGLRWMYRLAKEPGRLWPKYFGTLQFLLKNSRVFINALVFNKKGH